MKMRVVTLLVLLALCLQVFLVVFVGLILCLFFLQAFASQSGVQQIDGQGVSNCQESRAQGEAISKCRRSLPSGT